MSRSTLWTRFRRGECGATAAEFALILPGLVMLTIGVINLSLMLYAVATIHFTAETAARWCMINAATCTNGTVNTYATSIYYGPAIAPNFALATPTCTGRQVTGAAVYNFFTGVADFPVQIGATACHPLG
jgi:Flp pilus assembly protein TadG